MFGEFWSDAGIYGGGGVVCGVILGGLTKIGYGVLGVIPSILVMADNSTGDDSAYDKLDDNDENREKEVVNCPCICRKN